MFAILGSMFNVEVLIMTTENEELKTYIFKPSLNGYKEYIFIYVLILLVSIIGIVYFRINISMLKQYIMIFFLIFSTLLISLFKIIDLLLIIKTTKYTLSPMRLNLGEGYVRRNISNLELWRVSDVQLNQNFLQILLNECTIYLITRDVSHPTMKIGGLTKDKGKKIYTILNEYVAFALNNNSILNQV